MEDSTKISLKETLLPALMQCFGIIFLGYILGKIKILRQDEAKGLSIFVQYLALPALIFSTVSTIPFTEVKWEFVASVFIAKACVFVCVAFISILLTHPLHLGKAGIYAIAATQSNDFALGYPLLVSLYQSLHPEYTMYLYIIAPIQLLLFNGIGFFYLEMEKYNQSDSRWKKCHMLYIIKEIFKNPVIIMTIIGLIWNVTYGQKVLPILDSVLKAFSAAFPATALLLLGYTMNLSSKNSSHISLPVALIIIAKCLILPIALQKFTLLLLKNNPADEIQSFSNFGFLYGTIPTAPTVYVFATQYESCVEVIAKTILGSTLVSAPLMFSSASIISLVQTGIENFEFYLSQTICYTSLINAACCIWLLILFYIGKRWRNISFGIIIYLVIAQCLTAIGGLILFASPAKHTVLFYVQYVLTSGSIYSTRMCTVLLAILFLVIRIRSLCFILRWKKLINILSVIIGLFLPYFVASFLILNHNQDYFKPNYQLGYSQIVTTFILSSFTLFGTVLCLILQQIYSKKKYHTLNNINGYYQSPEIVENHNPSVVCASHRNTQETSECCDIEDIGKSLRPINCSYNEETDIQHEIENHVCDSNYQCSIERRSDCVVQLSKYINENQEIGTGINDGEHFLKHIGLLIVLCVAMTLSLSVCLWKLIETINGVFIELEFLDAIVNYSLGIFYFIIFGFDRNLLHIIYSKWKSCLIKLVPCDKDCSDECEISEQFVVYYKGNCKSAIAEDKIVNKIEYQDVFEKDSIIQWLLKENLVETVDEAENYIKCLLIDNVLEKVYEHNNFSKYLHLLRFTEVYSHIYEI